jgi:demethylmenaquinone methyltransferase/2-methoxy-6-polyprenyl-1,4-benzoquinol methylase
VDAATVAFGIRNVQRPELACAELARALKPGGRLAILEFGVPRLPGIGKLYLWYFRYLLPLVGRTISGHNAAYSYLPASVGAFPPPAEFVTILRHAGFTDVRAVPLTAGIVYLYTARRARETAGLSLNPTK